MAADMSSASRLPGSAAAVGVPGLACGGPDQPAATGGRKRQRQTAGGTLSAAQRTDRLGAFRDLKPVCCGCATTIAECCCKAFEGKRIKAYFIRCQSSIELIQNYFGLLGYCVVRSSLTDLIVVLNLTLKAKIHPINLNHKVG